MEMNRHILIANKVLIAMSGLTRWTKRANYYHYEQHFYNIPACFTAFRWTKSRIRHILSILAYADDQGNIEFIEDHMVADLACTSVRSLHNNLKMFEENGLMTVVRHFPGVISIHLTDYLENYRDLFVDGTSVGSKTGYTSIWHGLLSELIALDNVNTLRLALRTLVQVEKDVYVQSNEHAILTYDEIKGFLPKYCGHKLAIQKMMSGLQFLQVSLVEDSKRFLNIVKQNVSLKKRVQDVTRPLLLEVHLSAAQDSKQIKEKERSEVQLLWFELRKRAGEFFDFDALKVSRDSLFSISDTFGAETFKQVIEEVKQAFIHHREDLVHSSAHKLFFEEPIIYLHQQLKATQVKMAIA
ncbi:conserved hypothetical protein [Exiguobacterium sp. 8H]|uniref:hypothetical protein n=1 Tax=unclassified Exiguobacterium TaxID=2644629 RepID=UPI0012F1107E|nr:MULTISPECIES: hypothetical protein [unclassified Exiguobacterium]VXB83012.1 conserved hypothetical protein [Exiguobacterium sp. 8H]VXB92968.1 conserved hypothetical protein [Exiguobacterium sp. 8A]